jgi:peptidoglycan/LPS O-acetylase OafA/YrhL
MTFRYKMFMDRLISHRQYFMGVAIILIILSHLLYVCKEIHLLWIFYPGFVGVDIFLFLSGYGLCNSWEKNSIKEFYVRRLRRILPMFLLFQFYVCINQYLTDMGISWFDAFCNLTSLSFWGIGGLLLEWYLSFLLYLYLLFPVFYNITRKGGMVLLVSLLMGVLAMQYLEDWPWNIDAAFPRIPIFVAGILCYQTCNKKHSFLVMSFYFAIAAILIACMFIMHKAEKYQIVYMCAPSIMILLSVASKKITEKQNYAYQLFSFCGKISLEMYVANMIVFPLLITCNLPVYIRLISCIVSQILLTIILVQLNKIIKKKHAV